MIEPFNVSQRLRIISAIRIAERETSGEIRVHIKKKIKGDIMDAARAAFIKLGMDRTKIRNGVLFFIVLAQKKFAVLGDQGINEAVPEDFWESTVSAMREHFMKGDIPGGIEAGILRAGEALKEYFPRKSNDKNELPDDITVE